MIHTSLTEDSYNGSGNVHDYQTQSAARPHSSYPLDEQSYIPETQTSAPKEQLQPQIYAPVPMYSQQNLVSSEFPPSPAIQDGVYHHDTSYHQTVSSLDPGSHKDRG